MAKQRVLLGGVPFGRNNIGDEAILAAVVKLVRTVSPEAEISVMTDSPQATKEKLGVRPFPLVHFLSRSKLLDAVKFYRMLNQHDSFIWCGATGLSDYPHIPLDLVMSAKNRGLKTSLFCVGMNDRLNPAFFSVGPGRKRALLQGIQTVTGGLLDPIKMIEESKERGLFKKLESTLSTTDLIILRDRGSQKELLRSGLKRPTFVGADPALLIEPTLRESLPLSAFQVDQLKSVTRKKVGLCISSQSAPKDIVTLAKALDEIVESCSADIYCIPMNPLTDAELMQVIKLEMRRKDRVFMVSGLKEPEDVAGFASLMDVVISSRLHLLILSSISHIPLVGISRGSKIDNYLNGYGLSSVGSVETLAKEILVKEVERQIETKPAFQRRSRAVKQVMLNRLYGAKEKLRALMN